MNYKLTIKAVDFLKGKLKTVDGVTELIPLFRLKEAQIKNIVKDNSINGTLTRFAVVEYIKENSSLRSESKILETV